MKPHGDIEVLFFSTLLLIYRIGSDTFCLFCMIDLHYTILPIQLFFFYYYSYFYHLFVFCYFFAFCRFLLYCLFRSFMFFLYCDFGFFFCPFSLLLFFCFFLLPLILNFFLSFCKLEEELFKYDLIDSWRNGLTFPCINNDKTLSNKMLMNKQLVLLHGLMTKLTYHIFR